MASQLEISRALYELNRAIAAGEKSFTSPPPLERPGMAEAREEEAKREAAERRVIVTRVREIESIVLGGR